MHRLLKGGGALRRFAGATGAAVAVEFALIMPLLILLYFGTVEASSLYAVDRRVATVSATMADLVSRENGCITNATLQSYFAAATGIMQPYPTNGLKQVVSLLNIQSDGTVKVVWSRPYGTGATGRPENRTTTEIATPALAPQMNALARAQGWLVAAEITYPYTPLFGLVIRDVALSHTQFFLPRYQKQVSFQASSCN